ncbi:hypothetical protein LAD67_05770 [Escherichia coli]|nr:hypothetical protein [Escherichia coli]
MAHYQPLRSWENANNPGANCRSRNVGANRFRDCAAVVSGANQYSDNLTVLLAICVAMNWLCRGNAEIKKAIVNLL